MKRSLSSPDLSKQRESFLGSYSSDSESLTEEEDQCRCITCSSFATRQKDPDEEQDCDSDCDSDSESESDDDSSSFDDLITKTLPTHREKANTLFDKVVALGLPQDFAITKQFDSIFFTVQIPGRNGKLLYVSLPLDQDGRVAMWFSSKGTDDETTIKHPNIRLGNFPNIPSIIHRQIYFLQCPQVFDSQKRARATPVS